MSLDKYISNFEFMTSDKPNLNAMNWFMKELNHPEKKLKFIHIAGTNGKGSICEMLSKILITSGYKVGKFISPYLITLNEAICINNYYFSKDDENYYIPLIDKLVKKYIKTFSVKPSRFEIETTLALLYFFNNNCDIVILEVGLGGLFDCTNIIPNSISIIGSISLDHTNILGNTIQEIALQKAGIIKENSDTIKFSQKAIDNIIKKVCKEKNNRLHIINSKDISNIYHTTYKNTHSLKTLYQSFDYKNFKNIKLNLLGSKQIENACVVLETLNILERKGFKISEENIKNSLANIVHPARFEILSENPNIIYDGAHNSNAIDNFINTINDYLDFNYTKTFIISIIKNKDYKSILSKLCISFPNSTFIFTNGTKEEKFISKEILYEFAKSLNTSNFLKTSDFTEAIKNTNSDFNFIVGSFYTYKLLKDIL